MVSTFPPRRGDLPGAVIDLAMRLGAQGGPSSSPDGSIVSLSQTGRMLRALGKDDWMFFTARQTIETGACNFAWRARFAPFGLVSACDALENGVGRLDVTALGFIPIARTPHTAALMRGELLRYLAELAWAPDAMLENTALRWRESGSGDLIVGAGDGPSGPIARDRLPSRTFPRLGAVAFPTIGSISVDGSLSLARLRGRSTERRRFTGREKLKAGRRAHRATPLHHLPSR